MTGQLKQDRIVHIGHYMADCQWANCYGWAVNNMLALMLDCM